MKIRKTHQNAGCSARGSLWRAGVLAGAAVCALFLTGCAGSDAESFSTDYFRIDVNKRGYITGMWNTTRESRNFSPADQPSPLLSLYDEELKRYYYPQKAEYKNGKYRLSYENGSVATVAFEAKSRTSSSNSRVWSHATASTTFSGVATTPISTTCWVR